MAFDYLAGDDPYTYSVVQFYLRKIRTGKQKHAHAA